LNKLFDEYFYEKGIIPEKTLSRKFKSVQLHMIRGTRYLVTVDDETLGNHTTSMLSILLKQGSTFKVKSRFGIRNAHSPDVDLLKHINSKNMMNIMIASKDI
jgi:hypothetical protein